MTLPKNKNFSEYDNYLTDADPTTAAQAQDYFKNQADLLKAVIDSGYWQPDTKYAFGAVVKSDSMPSGTEAICVAENGGLSSGVEPSWGEVGGANVSDGTCFWKLRWKHWSKEVASVDDMKNGTSNDKLVTPKLARLGQTATNRLPNTTYSVGNVVYVDSNLSVALMCTTAGTTSNTELDISGVSVGERVEDGTCIWDVVKRDLSEDVKANTKAINAEKNKVQPIELGGTGIEADKPCDIANGLELFFLGQGSGGAIPNIPSGADLNDYVTAGTYLINGGTIANSLLNAPEIGGGAKVVVSNVYDKYGTQMIFNANWRGVWYRNFYHNGTNFVWNNWTNLSGVQDYSIESSVISSGYVRFGGITGGLIFAWKVVSKSQTGNPITVTKPIPMQTIMAYTSDITNSNSFHQQGWDYEATTNTTDKFYRGAIDDVFIIFWIGKAV